MDGMNVKDYDYDLPEELIAQDPLEDRSSSTDGFRDFSFSTHISVSQICFQKDPTSAQTADCRIFFLYSLSHMAFFFKQ